jgi:hypothetical protein
MAKSFKSVEYIDNSDLDKVIDLASSNSESESDNWSLFSTGNKEKPVHISRCFLEVSRHSD